MVIGKNPSFVRTNKSDTELWDTGSFCPGGSYSFTRRKGMKLKRHKNIKPQSSICVTELLKLFRELKPETTVVSPSIYQIMLLTAHVETAETQLLALVPTAVHFP